MKRIYFIRHGQSVANINKTHAGWAQMPLTEQGKADALRARAILEGMSFDKVYSSDLIRAIDTQMIALPGIEGERTPLLREINVGELAMVPFEECRVRYGDEYDEDRRLFNFKPYGGEDYGELCARIKEFFSLVESSEHERVAAFSHGGLINTALEIVAGTRLERSKFRCDNCGVTVFELKGSEWCLKLWNYTGEL